MLAQTILVKSGDGVKLVATIRWLNGVVSCEDSHGLSVWIHSKAKHGIAIRASYGFLLSNIQVNDLRFMPAIAAHLRNNFQVTVELGPLHLVADCDTSSTSPST